MCAKVSSMNPASAAAHYAGHLSNGDGAAMSRAYKPTHPDSFEVRFEEGKFNSYLVALKSFPKDSVIANFSSATPSNVVRYSTVQVGESSHIEINSDLLYCNHSCTPTVRFDVSGPRESWCARAERDLKAGDVLTFFYPSTEWDMSQPFQCQCQTSACLGTISGARYVDADVLSRYFVNRHIAELKRSQAREQGRQE